MKNNFPKRKPALKNYFGINAKKSGGFYLMTLEDREKNTRCCFCFSILTVKNCCAEFCSCHKAQTAKKHNDELIENSKTD